MKFFKEINKYIVSEHITETSDDIVKDDYVTKCMGAFGYYQALICPIIFAVKFIVSWNIIAIVFLTPATEFSCVKFSNTTDLLNVVQNSTCYAECTEYKYYPTVFEETLISRFELICERAWLKSFTQSIIMCGLVIGVSLLGWFSDRYGRRKAYLLATTISVVFSLTSPFAPSYWTFTGLRFFVGIGIGGLMILSVVVNIEMVGQKHREIAGALSLTPDGIGQMIIAVFAYFTKTWQTFMLISGLISVLLLLMLFPVPESPRWLVAQRKSEEAIALMTKVAKFNGLNTAHIKDTVNKAIEEMECHQKEVQKVHLVDLFATSYLFKTTITNIFMWTCGGVCFFGLNHYSTLLGLNIFTVVPLMGALITLGTLVALPITKLMSRKLASFCAFCIIGVAMVALIFIPDGHWGCTVTTGIGMTFSIILFSIIYIQVNELYPTTLRSLGAGVSSAGAKVGAMISPFIANMHPHWAASTVFAVVPFVGAILCLLLPETKGKQLRDTIK